jgi:hypothetical protein
MRILCGLAIAFALSGCVGYVQGDGGGVVVNEPDEYLFGGYFGGGHDRDYGRRGAESRGGGRSGGAAITRSGGHGGGAPAGHAGGGGGKR